MCELGKIFWVIKLGAPQTSMVRAKRSLSGDEIRANIQYERSFAGKHGPGMMGHEKGMGPMMGPAGGMGPRGGECCPWSDSNQ
jgi:hypothetical protein